MFYKQRIERLERHINNLEEERTRLQNQLWTLEGRITRILDHLGVHEVTIHTTELRAKGGPEPPRVKDGRTPETALDPIIERVSKAPRPAGGGR